MQPRPDIRPDDQRYFDRLTPDQLEYFRHLRDAETMEPVPDQNPDGLPNTSPLPAPAPQNPPERDADRGGCVAHDVRRRGGHAQHDAYATRKSQSAFDYFARAPNLDAINYDGRTPLTALVWEVKVGHGWFFNCQLAALRDLKLRQWDAQKDRGMSVARQCGYFHLWACQDRWVAGLLNNRWGGTPPVGT